MKTQFFRPSGTRGRLLALGLFAPICHVHAASGTWTTNGPGNWSDTTKWAGGVVASGATFTADFSTLNIAADHVVTIDAPFTIGTLQISDATTASNSWTFAGPGTLTLDNGGSAPVINVANRFPVISAPVAGSNGLTKTGGGQLTLSGNNTLSGTMTLSDVTGTNGAGLVLASNTAIGGITTINVNGNTNISGQYLALSGGVTLDSGVTINLSSQGGNNAPPGGIRSEGAGTINVINGPINITQNATRISNNSATRLDIGGVITGGANAVTFRNAGNEGIHLTNTGNSWTGTTVHSGGTLWFEPNALPAANIQISASDPGTIQTYGTFNRALGTASGEAQFTLAAGRAMGISARGGDLTVNFGGAAAEVFFDTGGAATAATIRSSILVLNNATSTHKLTLANPINLNGVNRTLQVDANTTEITGGLRGGAFTYTKTGAGTLLLQILNPWLGDLTIGGTGDSVNGGIVRATHAEALGAAASVKNINTQGLNRGTSIVELDNNITIDANKQLRMWGKNFAMTGATGTGLQQSLRSVSGNNAWHGNVIIFNSGGSYGMECLAGTLTVGASPATTSLMRNEVSNSTRTMSLYGPGNFVIHNKIADHVVAALPANITLNKSGTGTLTIARTDNDFDTVPNLFAGTTDIASLANGGAVSSLGVATSVNLGATLRYTGTGSTSDRALSLLPGGGTLDASGTGALVLNSPTFTHHAGITGTIALPFALGETNLVLNETAGIAVGQTIAGTNIPANTTVTAVNPDTRTVTISSPTSAASTVGVAITIGGATTPDRTLTLTGNNTGNNTLSAALSNPAGTGDLSVLKTGPGTWLLNGTSQTYTGTTQVNQGTLGFDGALPDLDNLTVAASATLSLANVELRVDPDTDRALDIDGNLIVAGPVNIVLDEAAPAGNYTVLDYASITGTANLTSNYRGTSFTGGATSASMNVGAAVPLTWTGATDNLWDTKATTNWKNATNVPHTFFWGDPVRFDDTGAVAPTVDLVGELRPGSVTIDASIVEYLLQGAGTLTGPFPLTKTGSATAFINGTHSFTGGITVNNGILKPMANQALGGTGNNITVNSGGTLDTNGAMTANRDYDATIAGSGAGGAGAIVNSGLDHVSGVGTLTLAGNATVGGTGRWDVRPIAAGTAFVDLNGFTLTKTGANYIGFADGTISEPGGIDLTQGTLALTRMFVSGNGSINVTNGAVLQFENNTTGSCDKAITLNNGSLRLQGSNYTLASEVTATADATFDVEATRTLTVTGAVVGTGNLVKSANTGGLTLTGTNTYDGTTTINAGTLVIGTQATLGTLGDGAVTNNGSLVINRGDSAYVLNNAISGSGLLTIGQGNGGSFESLVTVTGANTFTGNVAVASGGMKIFNAAALGTGPKSVILTNGTNGRPQFYLDGSGGNITLPADVSFTTSSTNTLQPAVGNSAGDNVINGNFTITSGGGSTAISVFGGSLTLNGNLAPDVNNRRVIFGGTTGTGTVNGIISGTGGNAMGIDKEGATVWTLTGANTYTGTTAVNAGTLLVNGNQGLASGAVSIANGATLGGTGTVGGTITSVAGGTVAPGTSIGTLTTTAPVNLAGTLAIELDATSSDRLSVGGSLTLTGSTLNVSVSGSPSQPAYIIASYGLLTGTFADAFGIPAGYAVDYNYNGLNQIALVQSTDAYGSWETANGIAGAGSGVDSDGDSIPNGIEFVIGGDPSGPGSASNSLLPTATIDATYLVFVYRRTDDSASYDPFVEYGSSLTGWTEAQAGVDGVIVAEDNNFFGPSIDRVTVSIPRALAVPVGTKLFARLRVDIP